MDTRTRRPDLEVLEYARPNYITDMIFPMLPRGERQGTLYYRDIQADVSAQTGRSGGAAPTEQTVTDSNVSFNLSNDEFIVREKIADAEIAGLGGLDSAQQIASRVAKRAVGNAIEDLTAANILANVSVTYNDIGTSLIDAVSTGFDTLADYAGQGEIALVVSSKLFSMIKRFEEVKDRMKFTGIVADDIRAVRNVSSVQLAALLGVDRVIVGNNEQWYTQSGTYQDRAALVKVPSMGIDPREDTQVGRTLWFSANDDAPAGDALFEVHSWYNEDKLSEMVDCRAYAEQKVLNTELIYGLDGIDTDLIS